MARASAFAICAALVTLSSSATAQIALTETLRLQGGYITDARPAPLPRVNDLFVSAMPEVGLLYSQGITRLSLTYTLTGGLHSVGGASEISNRLGLAAAFELTRRTTLVVSAFGTQTTLNNFLLTQPAATGSVSLFPSASSRLVMGGVAQGLSYELTPRIRVDQQADAGVVTTLAPTPPLDTFYGGVGGGIEHIWRRDGVGAEARTVYTLARATPPTPDQEYVTFTAGPRWRHDWSPSLSSVVAVGATGVTSPDPGSKPLVAPYGRGALLYVVGETTADLSVTSSIMPTPLTGQLVHSHQVTLHGMKPIHAHARIYGGASIGYLRGSIIDRVNRANEQSFDSVLTDVDVMWQASALMQVFARYQFVAQIGETMATGVNPSFLRDMVLVGVAISSRPPEARAGGRVGGGPEVSTRLPQRVDRADGATGATGSQQTETAPEGAGGSRWIHTTPAAPPQEEPRD